jgi:hypothetical protein
MLKQGKTTATPAPHSPCRNAFNDFNAFNTFNDFNTSHHPSSRFFSFCDLLPMAAVYPNNPAPHRFSRVRPAYPIERTTNNHFGPAPFRGRIAFTRLNPIHD